ncbi:MAG: AMP-binding protein [Alphaproteobacteria bacterium]
MDRLAEREDLAHVSEIDASDKHAGPARPEGPKVLQIVDQLARELHPHRSAVRAELDSRLDRDLGFDSLGRVELLYRLERAFSVRLPEGLLGEAETPRDLLAAVLRGEAEARPPGAAPMRLTHLEAAEVAPGAVPTLTGVLEWHVDRHPDRPHVVLADGPTITYAELDRAARAVAEGLRHRGLEPGERVAIMLPTGASFFQGFFGVLYAGGVPVPLYPPMRRSQIEEHLRRQAVILRNAEATVLIAEAEAHRLTALLKTQVPSLGWIATVEELTVPDSQGAGPPSAAVADEIALIQYTSGSTGSPKGVVLTHANLLANIRAMGQAMNASPDDVFVSWLPLYHDMGLIGAWLGSLYYAAPAVIMPALRFLARPERWLWAIHQHRATLSAAPNFGFELCLAKIDDAAVDGLDLGSLRMVANGAEPVSAETVRRFTARFARYGFRPETMAPVYGLAENSVGLAFPPTGRRPQIDRIERTALTSRGVAVPARADDPTALEFVGCGFPLPGNEIRIVDATGREVGERHQGRLQFRGPSATSGYFRDALRTRELFQGTWLDSGDLAYIAGGEVFVTGRRKDIIIRAGRNIYPQEVEDTLGRIEGVRRGCVAVFGSADPASGTERVVVLAETRRTDAGARRELERRIEEITTDLLETPPDDIVLAPPRTVPKTSSGKIRRTAAREIYEKSQVGARPHGLWWQIARLTLAGLWPEARRGMRATSSLVYAGYWWAAVALVCAVAWPLVVVLPRRSWRWRVLRGACRVALQLTRTPVEVVGLRDLPPDSTVLVANHSSYVDSIVLVAVLPGEMVFVAKKELLRQFFAGLFLRRIETLFVERMDPEEGLEDAERALAKARAGRRLAFYPEGTLGRAPGLLPFHLGAFTVAVQSGLPVTPVTLKGTRSILRAGQWFPRRGRVEVRIAKPVGARGSDFGAAVALRDTVRAEMLRACGEPDLDR